MPSIAVIGTQWGDEGKAKIVDLLAQRADAVVRSSGGNNAGHSVIVAGTKYRFSSVPCVFFSMPGLKPRLLPLSW